MLLFFKGKPIHQGKFKVRLEYDDTHICPALNDTEVSGTFDQKYDEWLRFLKYVNTDILPVTSAWRFKDETCEKKGFKGKFCATCMYLKVFKESDIKHIVTHLENINDDKLTKQEAL